MEYGTSLLRNKDYYPHENESIVEKWLKYKGDSTCKDLDTYMQAFYEKFWRELVSGTCTRRETMTSPLVTFEEYASFKGYEWKSQKAHGVNTFIAHMKHKLQLEGDEFLGKQLCEFLELTTSCCNMLPVPEYFNAGRSGPFAKWDYWDLALSQIYKWFEFGKKDNIEGQKDALRLMFAHSTHNYVFANRSTNMYDSIKYTEKWLMDFDGWVDFVKTLYLDSFVDRDNEWKPIKFWKTHSYELPLPTDTQFDKEENKKNEQIEKNFSELFENVNSMLRSRAQLLTEAEIQISIANK